MFSASLDILSASLLVLAAARDTATRMIPNVIPLTLLALGVCIRLSDGEFVIGAVVSVVIFAVTYAFWTLRLMGGGDVKLIAAFSTVLPTSSITTFLLVVALAGGILALLYVALRSIVARPAPGRRSGLFGRVLKAERWRISRHGSIPYAVAIASGGLFVLLPGLVPFLPR